MKRENEMKARRVFSILGSVVILVFLSLFLTVMGYANDSLERKSRRIDLNISTDLGILKVSQPAEVETVPEIHNYDQVSKTQFSRAKVRWLGSLEISAGLKIRPFPYESKVGGFTLGYSIGSMLCGGASDNVWYYEGIGSESYVFSRMGSKFGGRTIHNFFLGWTLMPKCSYGYGPSVYYKVLGVTFSETKVAITRGWYRYDKYSDYDSETANVSIISPSFLVSRDGKNFMGLSFDYCTLRYPNRGLEGHAYGVHLRCYHSFF